MDPFLEEATARALAIAQDLFPATFRPGVPDLLRLCAGLLARCVTSAEACLQLAKLHRRTDLMVCARTLYEHAAMFAWLSGSPDGEHRMLLMQRANDERALQIDEEVIAAGGKRRIGGDTRRAMAELAGALGKKRQPRLLDLVVRADEEWAERLAGPEKDYRWSLRSLYTTIYRPASSMAHPSVAGVALLTQRAPDGSVVVDLEKTGLGNEALQPVPALLGMTLLMSSHALGKPKPDKIFDFASWFEDKSQHP